MAGPVVGIELPGAVPDEDLVRLRALLSEICERVEEERPGHFDLQVLADRLAIANGDAPAGGRPFLVALAGIGDEETFTAEHADNPDLEPLIGFTPTHGVNVIAMCNREVDHAVTAHLTASIMDIVGGVAHVEFHQSNLPVMATLPGLIATLPEAFGATTFGTAQLLRTWAAHPDFRLVK
ncbi:DUF6368 family protein [Kitasatospora sp. GAS204B]|uniref:DUF6368 family protein n=1 Tax=unclassified Kitasatospora TaxID=2633591 RepID=UPI00247506D3|nr:DUF6368 family protein [Kitasatospora sp. GAS204B]MDH6120220.1 hypothetical protein [Kitasatospora sp. GAS204B]